MTSTPPATVAADPAHPQVRARNRRTVRALLAIVTALVVGSLLVGIRW